MTILTVHREVMHFNNLGGSLYREYTLYYHQRYILYKGSCKKKEYSWMDLLLHILTVSSISRSLRKPWASAFLLFEGFNFKKLLIFSN